MTAATNLCLLQIVAITEFCHTKPAHKQYADDLISHRFGDTFYCHLNKIEKLNNKILRILQSKPIRTHTIELYVNYDTLPPTLLHTYQILLFVHKFIHHPQTLPDIFISYFTQNSFIHSYNTRGKSNLHLTAVQSEIGKRALTYKGSTLWNKLPDKLKSMQSISKFKSSLRSHLISEYF